jgi:hypothetical protein
MPQFEQGQASKFGFISRKQINIPSTKCTHSAATHTPDAHDGLRAARHCPTAQRRPACPSREAAHKLWAVYQTASWHSSNIALSTLKRGQPSKPKHFGPYLFSGTSERGSTPGQAHKRSQAYPIISGKRLIIYSCTPRRRAINPFLYHPRDKSPSTRDGPTCSIEVKT